MNLLLCLTGSVATIKLSELIALLEKSVENLSIKLVATQKSRHFLDEEDEVLKKWELFTDEDEWKSWAKRGDPVRHIELRDWAEVVLIAPLGANSLAKIANGLCDNLLTCIIRACSPGKKTVVFCPAMNCGMLDHPLTRDHLRVLVEVLGFRCVPSISKTLICGESGQGAMAEIETIVEIVNEINRNL